MFGTLHDTTLSARVCVTQSLQDFKEVFILVGIQKAVFAGGSEITNLCGFVKLFFGTILENSIRK